MKKLEWNRLGVVITCRILKGTAGESNNCATAVVHDFLVHCTKVAPDYHKFANPTMNLDSNNLLMLFLLSFYLTSCFWLSEAQTNQDTISDSLLVSGSITTA